MIAVVSQLGRVEVHWSQTLTSLVRRLYGAETDVRYVGQKGRTHVHRVVGRWTPDVQVEVAKVYLPPHDELEAVVEAVKAQAQVTVVARHDLVRRAKAAARGRTS
jgi:hypothetical protein